MQRFNKFHGRLTLALGLALLMALAGQRVLLAQAPEAYIDVVRSYPAADFGVATLAGLVYSNPADTFLLLEAPNGAQAADTTRAVLVTPYQDPAGEVVIPATALDVQNTVFDGSGTRLVMFDQNAGDLITIPVDGTGKPGTSKDEVKRFNGRGLGIRRSQGMTVNPANGRLFILDAPGRRLVHVTPDEQQNLDGPRAQVGQVNLSRVAGQLRGIAFNPRNGHLFVLSTSARRLFEVTEAGELVSTRNLAGLGLRDPQAILFAPSADATDDPATMSLFLADGSQGTASSQIVELALEEPQFTALAGFTPTTPSLIQTIDTSKAAWNPSSPDPSGIAFQPSTGRLLISDGEVEENHPDYKGFNVFVSTLGGSLTGTCTTVGFSNEPTGMGLNPANGRVYISDDNQDRIYEINLGSDGQYCTSDDTRTFVATSTYGTIDAESVAVGGGNMYIGDGIGTEIWVVPLGANGVLGGGDDGAASHWDTAVMGLRDPEGVEYNPDTGTLYVVSTNTSDRRIVETTTTGTVVRILDITFLGSVPRSGLAYGPSSVNPEGRSLYMANRGVDNGADPNENDGKVYEIAVGTVSGGSTSTPTSTSTNTPTSTPEGQASTPTNTHTSTPVPPTSTSTNTPTSTPAGGTTTLTFGATADSYVQINTASTNFGAVTSLNVDSTPQANILFKFTVTGVGGRPVTGVRLRLHCIGGSNLGGSFYRVADSSWNESTVTWNNQPAADATALASLGAVTANNYYEVDLSSLITGDGTYSLRIASTSNDGADYASKERSNAALRPQLILTLGGTTAETSTPTSTTNGEPNTSTSTPTNTPVPPTSTSTSTPTSTPAGGTTTLTFGATADSYVVSTLATSNFGAATSLNVDNSPQANILFTFTVTGVGGRPVSGVRLRLHCIGSSNQGGSFYRVADTGWSENTVTWNNQPAADSAALASLGAVTANTSYEVDLASLITGDGTYSLRVASTSSDGADYTSKEGNAALRPQLVLTVDNP